MRLIPIPFLSLTAILLCGATTACAGVLTIEGAALYCDSARDAVAESLKNVGEVSDLKTDVDARRIVLKVATEASAAQAVAALAKSGFHGTAKFEGKTIAFPDSGVKPGLKRPIVMLTGPYLGCGASVTRLHQAIQKVESVQVVEIDRSARTVKLSGREVDVMEAVRAINEAGFQVALAADKGARPSP